MSLSLEDMKRKLEEKRMRLVNRDAVPVAPSDTATGAAAQAVLGVPSSASSSSVSSTSNSHVVADPIAAAPAAASMPAPPPPPPTSTTTTSKTSPPPEHVPAAATSAPPIPQSFHETPPFGTRLNHYAELTCLPPVTSTTFVDNFVAAPFVRDAAKRMMQRQEEKDAQNDISVSRKKSRKEVPLDAAPLQTLSSSTAPQADDTPAPPSSSGVVVAAAPRPRGYVDCSGAATASPCRLVEQYSYQGKLSEGVYGVVFRGTTTVNGQKKTYALKQIKGQWLAESQVGFPPYLLRELDLTLRMHHPNVVCTREIVYSQEEAPSRDEPQLQQSKSATTAAPPMHHSDAKPYHVSPPPAPSPLHYGVSVYAVMDFCWRDLKGFLYETKTPFVHLSKRNGHPDAPHVYVAKVKCIAQQLLEGVAFLHRHRILHRDLKTSNVLMSSDGTARLCDFGLSRFIRRREFLTPTVVTLMYRAPELHLGFSDYDYALDMWSVGCILAELFLKCPLFRAETEVEHCARVCQLLGYPTNATFEGVFLKKEALAVLTSCLATVPHSDATPDNAALRAFFTRGAETSYRGAHIIPPACIDLLCAILQWDPRRRLSAEEALQHAFFTEELPAPAQKAELVKPMPFQVLVAAATPGMRLEEAADGHHSLALTAAALKEAAELEDLAEQEAQAQGVRDTSPEAAARNRMLAADEDTSRVQTPLLVPISDM